MNTLKRHQIPAYHGNRGGYQDFHAASFCTMIATAGPGMLLTRIINDVKRIDFFDNIFCASLSRKPDSLWPEGLTGKHKKPLPFLFFYSSETAIILYRNEEFVNKIVFRLPKPNTQHQLGVSLSSIGAWPNRTKNSWPKAKLPL